MVKMTAAQARREIRTMLESHQIESATFESRVLVETVLNTRDLIGMGASELSAEQYDALLTLTRRRCQGEPLQYLCGEWEFFGLPFAVGEGVLIPRQDTETLVETVLRLRKGKPQTVMLDLCSGSGCIPSAVAAHLPDVTGYCAELSDQALFFLRQNLYRHAPQIEVIQMDVCHPDAAFLAEHAAFFDVITCNPPYLTSQDMQALQREVAYEPSLALYGGEDGLSFYRQLIPLWKGCVKPGGVMVFEVGKGQATDVCEIAQRVGFSADTVEDLCGVARVVIAQF